MPTHTWYLPFWQQSQSQNQPQQGQSHLGSYWSHGESQVSEDTDPRASPDSMALVSAPLPQVVGDLEIFFPGEGAFPHSL